MLHLIPNSLTCLNLLLGFAAIIAASQSDHHTATILVCVGVALDMADGWLARRLNAVSDFGRELDSLADVVTFGAAPSLILYYRFFSEAGLAGIVISALPLMAAALRLARFNLSGKSSEFCGLPCPAAALLLLSVSSWVERDLLAVSALIVLTAALMVSDLPYPARISKFAVIVCVAALVLLPTHALSLWAVGYATVGPLKRGGQWAKHRAVPALRLVREWATPAAETRPPLNRTL